MEIKIVETSLNLRVEKRLGKGNNDYLLSKEVAEKQLKLGADVYCNVEYMECNDANHDDVSDYRYQQLFTEICDYKEIYDSVGKEKYGLVLSHYPIFSWKNMGRGKILLYGHTHESEEDRFYQNCLRQMQENDCRHVYDKKLWACNVGCMLPYMNYTPRTLAEILAGVEAET